MVHPRIISPGGYILNIPAESALIVPAGLSGMGFLVSCDPAFLLGFGEGADSVVSGHELFQRCFSTHIAFNLDIIAADVHDSFIPDQLEDGSMPAISKVGAKL